ncbi:uncharacterized protein LOC130283728 [Hyla sarda]|uniref:uncharacterized protein LOC130283728 n=1 Tax=Hyla sarda TaxID=327740 RepID=UPI0024C28F72|nr:uncharacterized protein LOC130283728 [Hyla sarda]
MVTSGHIQGTFSTTGQSVRFSTWDSTKHVLRLGAGWGVGSLAPQWTGGQEDVLSWKLFTLLLSCGAPREIFFKAIFKHQPSYHDPIPSWDLPLVLKHLCEQPFEPLDKTSLKHASVMTIFLIAITSARRVSELQALSSKEPYLRLLADVVVLGTMPGFLPKVSSEAKLNQDSSSSLHLSRRDMPLLDVKRAIMIYLEKTASFRLSEGLFLQFYGPNKGKKASKSTLAKWLRDVITLWYSMEGIQSPLKHRAHSARSTTAS